MVSSDRDPYRIIPDHKGHDGEYLTTDGKTIMWAVLANGPSNPGDVDGGDFNP